MGIIVRQGIKNNIITYVGVLIGFFNILVLQPLILSPDELGLLRLLFSVSTLFVSIYPLGLNAFTIKYFPYMRNRENGHNGYLGFLILTTTILFIIGSAVFYGFKPYFLSKYTNSKMFVEEFGYIFPMSYFLGLFTMLIAYSSSIFKTTIPSFLNEIVSRILILSAVGLYFLKIISFEVVIAIYAFSYFILVIVLLLYFKKTDSLNLRINWKIFNSFPAPEAVKFTLFMCITTLASMSLRNIDAVFIGSYRNLSDVAVYSVALTIGSMIDVPSVALSKIVIPKLAEAFRHNNQIFIKDVYYKSNRICLLTGAYLFVLVFVNAYDILNLLPKKYIEGEWVLKLIAIGGLINTASGFNLNLIAYSKKYFVGTLFLTSLALLSAFSNIMLIPLFGLVGAAAGTSFSLIAINLVAIFYIKKRFDLQPFETIDVLILLLAVFIGVIDFFIPKMESSYISILIKSSTVSLIFMFVILKMDLLKNYKNLKR